MKRRYLLLHTPPIVAGLLLMMAGCSDNDRVTWSPTNANIPYISHWEIEIEKTVNTLPGHYVEVGLTLNRSERVMGLFDLLIDYDATRLAFTEAILAEEIAGCGWEYFTYRYNWVPDSPSGGRGQIRLVGMAETNNGAVHPDEDCLERLAGSRFVTLTFFVDPDVPETGLFIPLRFYWEDSGDNILGTLNRDSIAVNKNIYDIDSIRLDDDNIGYPGYAGVPDDDTCFERYYPVTFRSVDFINGGVDIIDTDTVSTSGDINVNGIAHEIADAVMFTGYFVDGLSAFGDHVGQSIEASDVNGNGGELELGDLVYLIRIIMGDALPDPSPDPGDEAEVVVNGDHISLSSSVDAGAVLLVFETTGEIYDPELLVSEMDMKFSVHESELRVLIYNIGGHAIPDGTTDILRLQGTFDLVTTEVAAYEGYNIETTITTVSK